MSDELAEKVLAQHIEAERVAFMNLQRVCEALDAKLDGLVREVAELKTEFRLKVRLAGAVVGFLSGIGGAVIVTLLT